MARFNMRRVVSIILTGGLLLISGTADAQPPSPHPSSTQTPAPTMPCPGMPMQGGMGSGMMMGQGGQMMNWQQMHEDMRAMRQEMVQLRAELQKHRRR